jgi:T-complex protein 1 subunit eta
MSVRVMSCSLVSPQVRIDDPDMYQSIVDAEWDIIFEKLRLCVESGAQIILSRLPIGDLATQFFADRGLFCAGRVAGDDVARVSRATGAKVQSTVYGITPDVLGSCGDFEEKQVCAHACLCKCACVRLHDASVIATHRRLAQSVSTSSRNVKAPAARRWSCVVVPSSSSTKLSVPFTVRVRVSVAACCSGGWCFYCFHADSLMIVKNCVKSSKIVAGGGAIELEISRYLKEHSLTIPGACQPVLAAVWVNGCWASLLSSSGKQQLVIAAYARSLEIIPRQLADNAGFDSTDILNALRHTHTTE